MTVRSKRLTSAVNVNTASQLIYTAGSGETVLIKSVLFYNSDTVTRTLILGRSNTGVGTIMKRTLATLEPELVDCWFVLQPGDTLWAGHSGFVAGAIGRITLFGAELEGVAD